MPHNTEVHLPSTWKKVNVYMRMKLVSPSYFSHLWLQHLAEFVIKKSVSTRSTWLRNKLRFMGCTCKFS